MPLVTSNFVLVCLEHPGRQDPENLISQDPDLKVEVLWTGPVRGWWGTSVQLFGKLVATTETVPTVDPPTNPPPEPIVTTVFDIPAFPNYIVETVQLGPIGANGLPTVEFVGGGQLAGQTSTPAALRASASLSKGVLAMGVENFDNGQVYYAFGEWVFAVLSEEDARRLSPGIHVRGSFYSIE